MQLKYLINEFNNMNATKERLLDAIYEAECECEDSVIISIDDAYYCKNAIIERLSEIAKIEVNNE